MIPLLLLAALADAHGGADHAHGDEATAHASDAPSERTRSLGDLDVEGELARLGLPWKAAVRMTATWFDPIAAPERTVAEGRARNWAFGEPTVHVEQRRLIDGQVLADVDGRGRQAGTERCARLGPAQDTPLTLAPLDPRARERGAMEQPRNDRMKVTWVDTPEARTAIVHVRPGESATVVELVPDADARPRRRARSRRRLEVQRDDVELVVREDEGATRVCVTPTEGPEEVEVVRGGRLEREPPPLPPPLTVDGVDASAEADPISEPDR